MKKQILLFVISGSIGLSAFAQAIKVEESMEKMSQGTNNGLSVVIPEADAKQVEKDWKKRMKDFDAKTSNEKGDVFADDASIKALGDNTVDVYARAEDQKDGGARLVVFFNLGGAYLSSTRHPDQYKGAHELVYEFAVETAKEAIEEQLKEAEKQLESLVKDQERLVKDNEDLHKDIEDYQEKIKQAEADIEQNLKDQENKKIEIGEQQKAVETVKEKLKKVE